MPNENGPVILYDGVCGLCNGLIGWVLPRDHHAVFRFAPLQSAFAQRVLQARSDTVDLNTVYVVLDPDGPTERLLRRSRAVLYVLRVLGGWYRWPSAVAGVLPTPLLNLAYRAVATGRYRTYGRYESCPLPRPEWAERFLDTP